MANAVPDSSNPVESPNRDLAKEFDEIVEACERNEEADGKHGAGHGIADGGNRACALHQFRARLPPRIGEHHGEADRESRGRGGEQKAVQRGLPERTSQAPSQMCEGIVKQYRRRDHEADQDGNAAGKRRERAARTLKPFFRQAAVFVGGMVETARASQRQLENEQREDEEQHDASDLRRAREIVAVEPGIVDGDRERSYPEELHGADVIQRLHERKRDAGGERGPGQRQGNLPKSLGRVAPERPAHFQDADRLGDEARSGGDIHIRIEHGAHHKNGAAQAADFGEPIAPRVMPAEESAQTALHRPGIIEQLEIAIGDDVGRDRKRQEQQPLKITAPGKTIHGDEPSRPGADQERQHADARQQQQRAAQSSREHIGDEMRPGVAARFERDRDDGEDRQERDHRYDECRRRPAEVAAFLEPCEPPAQRRPLR